MSQPAIKTEDLSKLYRLGEVGTGSFAHDLNRWWQTSILGKTDPYAKVATTNDRTLKAVRGEHVWALKDVSLEVEKGAVLGIIGRNGAGKSTLLKLLSRVTSPTTGSIKINGRIASLLEVGTGFHPELTGRENIYMNGTIMGMNRHEIKSKLDEIVAFAGIEKYLDTPSKRYSSGMTVRLGFAIAAFLEPEILIVDEVLAVGDAEFQQKAVGKMKEVSDGQGRTVLFVSHNMVSIQNLCERSVLLNQGSIEMIDETDKVISAYLNKKQEQIGNKLADRTDRRGSGKVTMINFNMLDEYNNSIHQIINGSEVKFVFELENHTSDSLNVDVGLAIQNQYGHTLVILYSSYSNHYFDVNARSKKTIQFKMNKFPLAEGHYTLIGRILTNKEESDWLENGICRIDVIKGDFYGTGKSGNMGLGAFLIEGIWQ